MISLGKLPALLGRVGQGIRAAQAQPSYGIRKEMMPIQARIRSLMRPRLCGASLRDEPPFEINWSRLLVGGMFMLFGKDAFLGKTGVQGWSLAEN